jgi:sulfotransferase family protein
MSPTTAIKATPDPADEAMVVRAYERFRGERRRRRSRARKGRSEAYALPNLIVIGGLKCGTTSIHHYLNLHPEIAMSRPKELNFFVESLNWDLGEDWYRGHFHAEASVRGESSPHYTNHPRFAGVADRMGDLIPEAKLIYMVRDPFDRILSHYLHNLAGGYDTRPIEEALASTDSSYVDRSRYFMQLQPYLERFPAERIEIVEQGELKRDREATMRRVFRFLDVDDSFTHEQFSREWERGTRKASGKFRLMDRAVRMPGLRGMDARFDRLPEGMRWVVERIVHRPSAEAPPKPGLPPQARERLEPILREDAERLEEFTGRRFDRWFG